MDSVVLHKWKQGHVTGIW